MRRLRFALLAPLVLACTTPPAGAVIILDSTWAENGGTEESKGDGFGAHIELAREPQFAAHIGMKAGGDFNCSGTWIGNDEEGYGYVLTAAHCFNDGVKATYWTYFTTGGTEFQAIDVTIHPDYVQGGDTQGYDFAIVRLESSVEDGGEPPYLYGGSDELGSVVTVIGYGSRGIGSSGEDLAYYASEDAAAAHNVVDDLSEEDNYFQIDLDKEDGSVNHFPDGDAEPVDEYEGILGSGDSGGGTWIETDEGWAVAGVNSYGVGDTYGSYSGFARISGQMDWILEIFPDAQFTGTDEESSSDDGE